MNNLWSLDLSEVMDFESGKSEYLTNPEWNPIDTKGQVIPKPVSNHSSVVYDGSMYMFGGSNGNVDNVSMFKLDLSKYSWTVIKSKPLNGLQENFPHTRDEHSCVLYDNTMVIVGGFAYGERTNDIFQYFFKTNTWEKVNAVGLNSAPCPRVGHSAVIKYS
jgi:hypothetical protein